MKSYFLGSTAACHADLAAALTEALPGQIDPWLLRAGPSEADVVAYFSLVEVEAPPGRWEVQAEVSGRHYHRDTDVLAVLERLRVLVGGDITDDT